MGFTIGVIGRGFVGKATALTLGKADVLFYDVKPELCVPAGLTLKDMLDRCTVIFVCVPTPMNHDGSCCLSIVDSVYDDLVATGWNPNKTIVVLRSTVPPGTSDKYSFCFMPEFLTEANWESDARSASKLFVGIPTCFGTEEARCIEHDLVNVLENSWATYHCDSCWQPKPGKVIVGRAMDFELHKMFCNCFLATKVAFCNEVYRLCEKLDEEYDTSSTYSRLTDALKEDDRIGITHLAVPGPDGKFGFGGTCFPKDINSFLHEMKIRNIEAPIMKSVIYRNETIDRKEKEWLADKGRASV
jgi:UDPglucose 6-dehydrogenase